MNSNDKYFSIGLIGILAIFASVGYELAKPQATAPQEIVKLERVVIEGRRMAGAEPMLQARIQQLPRVVVLGRRADAATVLASAERCEPGSVC
ncbi:MAG: hypothetical protein ABW005_12130 [Burkholderiaceae bacterium]